MVKYASKKSGQSRIRICPIMDLMNETDETSQGSAPSASPPLWTVTGDCEVAADSCLQSPNWPSATPPHTTCVATLHERQLIHFEDVALPGSKGFVKVNGVKYKG